MAFTVRDFRRRHAFTAVVLETGFGIGRADEGIPGYTPRPDLGQFSSYDDEAKGRCPQCRSRPEQTGSIQNCVHYHEEVGLAGLYMADNVSVLRDKQAALRYAREQGCALICPGARPKMTAGVGASSYDLRRRSPTTSF